MEKEKSCLENLKEDYNELKKRYSLPDFDEMNKEFSIERISEIETDYLLKEVRKFLSDKFSNYLAFVETVLHPTNSSIFVFSFIKAMNKEDKQKLTNIYKELSKLRLKIIQLDTIYLEEKEAEFIKNSFEKWLEVKKTFSEVLEKIEKNWENKIEFNGRGYFD